MIKIERIFENSYIKKKPNKKAIICKFLDKEEYLETDIDSARILCLKMKMEIFITRDGN